MSKANSIFIVPHTPSGQVKFGNQIDELVKKLFQRNLIAQCKGDGHPVKVSCPASPRSLGCEVIKQGQGQQHNRTGSQTVVHHLVVFQESKCIHTYSIQEINVDSQRYKYMLSIVKVCERSQCVRLSPSQLGARLIKKK